MKLKYFMLLLLPAVLFASGAAEGEGKTDIVPRVINFVIFASILYYLIAKPLKDYFTGRTTEIADRLTSIQDKLKESKDEKEQALQSVKDADVSAVDIIETAKKEAEMLSDKVAQNLKKDLENLQKSHDDRIIVEEKKMSRGVVEEVIESIFDNGKINLKNDDFLNIIKKKVA
ncbi:MAG TPA: F0F1 ATP synthase subunit B [Campylobacterales bacterium]|nr:F0F1 ATP synthase subunit B [Campylobacterales bacterium]HIP59658.1 F0F1 ATP synthase subunit B [Campylobacterales bacterium]